MKTAEVALYTNIAILVMMVVGMFATQSALPLVGLLFLQSVEYYEDTHSED